MTRAERKGKELRKRLGLSGQVDAEAVANILGYEVVTWPFAKLEEMTHDDVIAVAARLDPPQRRWDIAHAIGHTQMHPGNHFWKRLHTGLAHGHEREAEDYARGLLFDIDEAIRQLLSGYEEVAGYFGIPTKLVGFQQPFKIDWD